MTSRDGQECPSYDRLLRDGQACLVLTVNLGMTSRDEQECPSYDRLLRDGQACLVLTVNLGMTSPRRAGVPCPTTVYSATGRSARPTTVSCATGRSALSYDGLSRDAQESAAVRNEEADGVGFEPTVRSPVQQFSRLPP